MIVIIEPRDIIKNIPLILLGPVVSLIAIIATDFKIKSEYFYYVGIGAAIALIVSIFTHLIITNDLKKSNIISVITSEFIYIILVIVTSVNAPQAMMWLPITLIFLPIVSLPTAISVSIGIGGIIKTTQE